MTTLQLADIESVETTENSDILTQLVTELADLRERVSDLETENQQLRSELADERQQRGQSDASIRQEVTDLRDELADERQQRGQSDASIRQEVTALTETLEQGSGDDTPTAESETTGSVPPQTPLEQVVSLDEEMAESELTANQQRARFVARDFRQYATSVPAGLSMESGDIRRVLRAGTDTKGRTATVSRVMDFLDDLGGDETRVVKRRGSRRLVADESLVARLETAVTGESRTDNTVVMSRAG